MNRRAGGVPGRPPDPPGEFAELTAERFAAMRRMSFHEMASRTRTEAELQEFASVRGVTGAGYGTGCKSKSSRG
jgi:hypothetical protein